MNQGNGFINYPHVYSSNNANEDLMILENAIKYSKDNNGCRIVQKKFEEKKAEFANLFFERVRLDRELNQCF